MYFRRILLSFFFVSLSLYPFVTIHAQEVPNNKVGIHVADLQDQDIERSAQLVNSNGGDWGYITVVIQDTDRDVGKWQKIFDHFREKHLIPLVRIATHPNGSNWDRPSNIDIDSWISFLNKLNWVVSNRYIILYNEPNHATEWGGAVDAKNYGMMIEQFARRLKAASSHYYIIPAGLDASAPSQLPAYEDEEVFVKDMVDAIGRDDFLFLFNGWASHSYPNPGFSGPAEASGRGTVRTYRWELDVLRSLGVHELPVFITETGWDADRVGRDLSAQRIQYAFQNIWLPDKLVQAITPFVLNYQAEPFLQFSWIRRGNDGVYPEYERVQALPKVKGMPKQDERALFHYDLPAAIVENSTYHFQVDIENRGQPVWSAENGYSFIAEGLEKQSYFTSQLGNVKPGQKKTMDIYLNTAQMKGSKKVVFTLQKQGNTVASSQMWDFEVVPIPSLDVKVSLAPKISTSGKDFELQIFDEYEQLVYRVRDLEVQNGEGRVEEVENIALGKKYRVVLLKPYYLPRQVFVRFSADHNSVIFPQMLPFDFNGDGALTGGDFGGIFSSPLLLRNLIP